MLPKTIDCPHCNVELELEESERSLGSIKCPACGKEIGSTYALHAKNQWMQIKQRRDAWLDDFLGEGVRKSREIKLAAGHLTAKSEGRDGAYIKTTRTYDTREYFLTLPSTGSKIEVLRCPDCGVTIEVELYPYETGMEHLRERILTYSFAILLGIILTIYSVIAYNMHIKNDILNFTAAMGFLSLWGTIPGLSNTIKRKQTSFFKTIRVPSEHGVLYDFYYPRLFDSNHTKGN